MATPKRLSSPMENLKKLNQELSQERRNPKGSRAGYRGRTTVLLDQATEVMQNFEPGDASQLRQLTRISREIQSKIELMKALDVQIILAAKDDADEERIVTAADEYYDTVYYRQDELDAFIEDQREQKNKPSTEKTSNSTPKSKPKSHTSIPKIALLKFDGDLKKWVSFRDSFNANIHDNPEISNVDKLQYLRGQLTGEAEAAIENLELSDENYENARKMLYDEYERPHKIIEAYLDSLLNLPTTSYERQSIKHLYSTLETSMRGLASMGVKEGQYDVLLVRIVLNQLPPMLRKLIEREHGDGPWQFKELRDALKKEITHEQPFIVAAPIATEVPTTTAVFHTSATKTHSVRQSTPQAKKEKSCAFCKGAHFPNDCAIVSDPDKRNHFAKQSGLCFNCLGKHRVSDCKSKGKCRNCSKRHHTSLCRGDPKPTAMVSENARESTATSRSDSKLQGTVSNTAIAQPVEPVHINFAKTESDSRDRRDQSMLLKTAVAPIIAGHNTATATIMFDEGATRSFITTDLASKLNIKPDGYEMIALSTFADHTPQKKSLQRVTFALQTRDGPQEMTALITPKISAPMRNMMKKPLVNLPHLRNLALAHPISDANFYEVSVLIGVDYYWDFVEDKTIRGPGPTAVQSKFGYLLSGPTGMKTALPFADTTMLHVATNTWEDDTKLQNFWDLETIGIKDDIHTTESKVSEFESFRKTHLRSADGKYVAKLPWKFDHPPLPTNYRVTEKRTRGMIRRLSPDLLKVYDGIINDQLSRDFIEEVRDDDVTRGHYLPHRSVKKDSPTTPIRVVYDCSCSQSADSPSLNDCLEKGSPLLNDLSEILLRFRANDVALTSDIEKAFLNVRLDEGDRDFTKFLWLSDPSDIESPFKVYRFKSVLFGAVCSPFILNAVVKTHLETNSANSTSADLKENIYVDNVVSGTGNTGDAMQYYENSNELMNTAGFNLRSWSSNCEEIRDRAAKDGTLEPNTNVNVLGLRWQTLSDNLTFAMKADLTSDDPLTKRKIAQSIGSVFDPLGMLSPVSIKGKVFNQKVWKENVAWDTPLSEMLTDEWKNIATDLQASLNVTFNRKYFSENTNLADAHELHVFVDASTKAYGAAAYIRNSNKTSLVMAKTRVAPMKETTIPRLELLAALIGARLLNFVYNALKDKMHITSRILWSDSQIVIHWIKSDKKLPIFITNRVKEINSLRCDVKYCPTKENPADLLTRGMSTRDLINSSLWWEGPAWLKHGDWPVCQLFDSAVYHINADDIHDVIDKRVNATPTRDNAQTSGIQHVVDANRYSSLTKLLRVTALVLRFVSNLLGRDPRKSGLLTADEIQRAETLWIEDVQREKFPDEIRSLKKQTKENTLARQLTLFLDEDRIIRCGGRLHNAPLEFDTKFPILLPSHHRFTNLVIYNAHSRVFHSGLQSTVTQLRRRFWIPKIRQVVKSLVRKCVTCLKVMGNSYRLPIQAPLQKYRVNEAPPFSITGVDFTGALLVRNRDGREKKAYVCLFTCAITRAVHLEIVEDLTTTSFLNAFRRFSARRSLPSKVISDNATTYQTAATELRELFKSPDVKQYFANKRVEWSFIPKRAPWFGGFWERMIGLTKTNMKKVLGRAFVSLDELNTIVAEIESTLNDRPITFLSADSDDEMPLTPSHLLHGRTLTNVPYPLVDEDEISDPSFEIQAKLKKRYLRISQLLEHFWRRWTSEYLPALREHHKLSGKTDNQIKTGDVVLVHSDTERRINWKLAVVVKLNYGNDGIVRSADIRTAKGQTNRPITKLYPLEVNANTILPTSDDNNNGDTQGKDRDLSNQRPPTRTAAAIARCKIQDLANV